MITTLVLAFVCLVLSAVYSGSETGFYNLSRLRVEAEARDGLWQSRIVRWLVRDEQRLLITILIGNNLVIECLTILAQDAARSSGKVPTEWLEVVVTAVLTPIVFFAGELLPKELFRLRPHLLVGACSPIVAASSGLFAVVAIPLRALSSLVMRVFRLRESDLSRVLGHEAVTELLAQSKQLGHVEPQAERLALNVLSLRGIAVSTEMVPWKDVEVLNADEPEEELRHRACRTRFSRLPWVEEGTVRGYVHQLDVLRAGDEVPLRDHLRPLPVLAQDLPVDRALVRLRGTGQRAALVGSAEDPQGLVTLKDLVETISGDLAGW